MWCKNNGCSKYDSINNKCKLPMCWMETQEYNGRFHEGENKMKEIMEKEFITREVELYNLVNFKNIDVEEVRKVHDVFANQGHSGFTAGYVLNWIQSLVNNYEDSIKKLESMLENDAGGLQHLIHANIMEIYDLIKDKDDEIKNILIKLLDFKPITPIMDGPEQWNKVGEGLYQNKRCSGVFKEIFSNGLEISYYIHDRAYSDDGGISFHTSSIYGRHEITFPFTPPESQRVYVYREDDSNCVYYLTNPETINKLKEICEKKYETQ